MEVIAKSSASQAYRVTDTSQVGEVRRAAGAMAKSLGFDEPRAGQVMVVATELVKNLAVHAKGGEAFLRPLTSDGDKGVELLVVDRGPGMADVSRCNRDGFSTAGTAGMGLGAVERMSDRFETHSVAGVGTVSVSRIWRTAPKGPTTRECIAGLAASPKIGEPVSGDVAAAINIDGRTALMLADGLGHGPLASEASMAALAVFEANLAVPPGEMMALIHAGLRRTRGAAVAVADVDWKRREVRFCGIGNIAASIGGGTKSQNLMSHNGTVGVTVGKVQEFRYPLVEGGVVFMNSDGLKTHWNLDRYPGVLTRDVSVIAGIVYRDNRRDRDDATVLVLREQCREREAG